MLPLAFYYLVVEIRNELEYNYERHKSESILSMCYILKVVHGALLVISYLIHDRMHVC